MVWNMPASVPKNMTKISWKYFEQKQRECDVHQLLGDSDATAPDSAFENWNLPNSSGVNYISKANENCKPPISRFL